MGNQKLKWTAEEEDALLAGISRHGQGKWKNILKDPDFAPYLTHRSNIDLKDKWRNLSVSNSSQGSKEKSRSKFRSLVMTSPLSQNSVACDGSADVSMDNLAIVVTNGKPVQRYNSMIFEALSAVNDTKGCDINTILHFIEPKLDVPQNFRRILGSKLRRLVSQGKLEKVHNCYRLKNEALLGTKTPTPPQKGRRQRQNYISRLTHGETVEEAAITAAYRVADAENKSYLAAEAVKEAERITNMAEDAEAVLQMVIELYGQCEDSETIL